MKKTTFVALLLLSSQCFAENLNDSLQSIESEWASIYYSTPKQHQDEAYNRLLDKTISLSRNFPGKAEPLIWEAIVKATNADNLDPVSALEAIHEARDLLLKAIEINPLAMDGSAYVTLGTLYYMAPKWPIAFGDAAAAERMLQTALKINPNGIDANYFYACVFQSKLPPKPLECGHLNRSKKPPYRSVATREVYFYSISLVVVKFACCFLSESPSNFIL